MDNCFLVDHIAEEIYIQTQHEIMRNHNRSATLERQYVLLNSIHWLTKCTLDNIAKNTNVLSIEVKVTQL